MVTLQQECICDISVGLQWTRYSAVPTDLDTAVSLCSWNTLLYKDSKIMFQYTVPEIEYPYTVPHIVQRIMSRMTKCTKGMEIFTKPITSKAIPVTKRKFLYTILHRYSGQNGTFSYLKEKVSYEQTE